MVLEQIGPLPHRPLWKSVIVYWQRHQRLVDQAKNVIDLCWVCNFKPSIRSQHVPINSTILILLARWNWLFILKAIFIDRLTWKLAFPCFLPIWIVSLKFQVSSSKRLGDVLIKFSNDENNIYIKKPQYTHSLQFIIIIVLVASTHILTDKTKVM